MNISGYIMEEPSGEPSKNHDNDELQSIWGPSTHPETYDYISAWRGVGAKYKVLGFSTDFEDPAVRSHTFTEELVKIKISLESCTSSPSIRDEQQRFYNKNRSMMIIRNFHAGMVSRNQTRVYVQDPELEYCPRDEYHSGKIACSPCKSFHEAPECSSRHELNGPIDVEDLLLEDLCFENLSAIYIGTHTKFLPNDCPDMLNLSITEDIDYYKNPGSFILKQVRTRLVKIRPTLEECPVILELNVEENGLLVSTIHRIVGELIDLKEEFNRDLIILIGLFGNNIRMVPTFPYGSQDQSRNKAFAAFDIGTISGIPVWPAYIFATKAGDNILRNGKSWLKQSREWNRYEYLYGTDGTKTREYYKRFSGELKRMVKLIKQASVYDWRRL
jgi:hypothetical protein